MSYPYYNGGSTNTGGALRYMHTNMLQVARPGFDRVAVVVTGKTLLAVC